MRSRGVLVHGLSTRRSRKSARRSQPDGIRHEKLSERQQRRRSGIGVLGSWRDTQPSAGTTRFGARELSQWVTRSGDWRQTPGRGQ